MIAIGAVAIKYGKWQRLVYGTDYQGEVCGSATGKESSVFITYPRTNEDFIANLGKKNPLDYKFYGICVDKCPGEYSATQRRSWRRPYPPSSPPFGPSPAPSHSPPPLFPLPSLFPHLQAPSTSSATTAWPPRRCTRWT
jgi:hypothetical protein